MVDHLWIAVGRKWVRISFGKLEEGAFGIVAVPEGP